MSIEILEHPVAVEIVRIAERREQRWRAMRVALEAAALPDGDFARWYTREFASLPRLVQSHALAYNLRNAYLAGRTREFAILRGRILRDLAREALKEERRSDGSTE